MSNPDKFTTKKIEVFVEKPLKENSAINTEELYKYLDAILKIVEDFICQPYLSPSVIYDFKRQYELLKLSISEQRFEVARSILTIMKVRIGVIYVSLGGPLPIVFELYPDLPDIGRVINEFEAQI